MQCSNSHWILSAATEEAAPKKNLLKPYQMEQAEILHLDLFVFVGPIGYRPNHGFQDKDAHKDKYEDKDKDIQEESLPVYISLSILSSNEYI